MKSFFSRLNDIQAGSSKPTKESSYKFWVPSNANAERSSPNPIPVHPDVVASHGEKRTRALKSIHPFKIPLPDLPTLPIETQAIHTNDMSRQTARPNLGSSSTPYSQNYPPPSRTPRPQDSDTRYQVPSHGPAYPTGNIRETSSKTYRGGRHESVAPVPPEIWHPSTTPAISKQVERTGEKLERHRETGDDMDRVKEPGKDRDRDRRERERGWEKGRTREREREERERERARAKERERNHEKEREIARAKREQDRNLETDRGRDRDKYAERGRRENERDSDREGETGKNRTKDKGSKKENSNMTRGNDVPYDGERIKQDERSKARHRDRTTGGGGKIDNRESHKERDRRLEKETERVKERLGGQIKHRVEATDSELDGGRVKTPAPDRERRKDPAIGGVSDTRTGYSRKKTPNRVEDGESSDSSTRPKRVQQVLTKRHRADEGGSSSKIIHSRPGIPAEPLASTKPSIVKATTVTVSDDAQLLVPPTPQYMPIYLPPKESNVIDSYLPLPIPSLNIVLARETEVPPGRETVNRLKSSRPDEPLHAVENVSKPREIDISTVRRPPSQGTAQPPNPVPPHLTITPSLKDTRESVYIHRPRHSQPPPATVHDKLQATGSFLLPEIPYTSTQAEVSKEPNHFLERLPDSKSKKELEVDLTPSVFYKAHRIVPGRQPTVSAPQTIIPPANTDPAPPSSNPDPGVHRKAAHLLQQGSNSQIAVEEDPSYNLQLHNRSLTVISGNNLAYEAHSRRGTPVAQVVLGKAEPMNPPSNTAMQRLQSAPLDENIIQDTGKQAAACDTVMVSKTNEMETVTPPKNEVSVSSIKPIERLSHQLYAGLSINRPSTAMDYRSSSVKGSAVRPHMTNPSFPVSQDTDTSKPYPLLSEWRNNVNTIPPALSNQEKFHVTSASNVDVHPKIPALKSNQSRSNGQESIGLAITRPSTTTGLRQNTFGKNSRHHNISLSQSDTQNSIGISIPRPSTATAIKQSGSGISSRQILNATSHKLNPLSEEAHSSIFSGSSIPKQNSIFATNLQPATLPITEKGPFPIQSYNMIPGPLSRGDAIVSPTVQLDVPGFQGQGHIDSSTDLNVISSPNNFPSQTSIILNPRPELLRNSTNPLVVSNPSLTDDLVQLHSTYRQDSRGASDPVPSMAQKSHQAFKENGVVPQRAALASTNKDDMGNNTIPTFLNAQVSNTQPLALPSSFTAPQIEIRRPPTSLSTRNNSVPSTLPSAVIVPQIQIHHLITTTGTANKSESPHTDYHTLASTPRTAADLETPDVTPPATATVNVHALPKQPQDFLDSAKFHRPLHLVSTPICHIANVNDARPSTSGGTVPSHAEDPRFSALRIGSSQEVSRQNFVNNRSATLPSHQPEFVSSVNQLRQDSVQNALNPQRNNNLVQGSPSLGFFNNAFSEILNSPVMQRSDGDRPAVKTDGKFHPGFEPDRDDTKQIIHMKISESFVNRDAVRSVPPKEQPEVPSAERLISPLHLDIHNSKVVSHLPSEVNRPSKCPPTPSQSRIQHPGLAEILSSPINNAGNGQPPSSSTAHHQSANSFTVLSKSGSPQVSLDKQRPDDKLMSLRSSPSRQSPSDLRHKEIEQHPRESPKRQMQQIPTPTSRSTHLQNFLSDSHGGNSPGLAPSNVPFSSSHPPNILHPPYTTSSIPNGITPPVEPTPHVYNKKSGQSDPEVLINTAGPSQVEEFASRKIRPPSIVDPKPLGNSIPPNRATTPLRELTPTTRHQYSASLPVHPVPSANVPLANGSLRAAAQPPLHQHSTSQTKSSYAHLPGSKTLTPNITHAASASEETILMTPSSLARSVLKPTVSRQSVTPSISSQTARNKTGLFTMFRSKTPAQPPPQYEIWHPDTSSKTDAKPSLTLPEQQKISAPSVPVASVPIAIERTNQKSKIFTPFHYLTTKRNRAVSLVSVEAQYGTAPSTVVGSPTASMHSQAPFQPPPVRDPMKATEEWRNKEEAETLPNGKVRRPGVVFDVAEERPEGDRQRPKRIRTRHKSSSKPS